LGKDEIEQLRVFYETFANKLQIFDPLDRPIPDEMNKQSLFQSELIGTLDELKAIESQYLLYPLDLKHIEAI
jgi:hypothetical protein